MSIVVITGGSRGIGAATAHAAARRGMGVILTYRHNPDAAASVVAGIAAGGGKAVALPLEIADTRGFPTFVAAVRDALRTTWQQTTLSGLVNNAGHGLYAPIDQVDTSQFDGLFNVHLKGPFFLTQALLPLLERGASIVNLTSATTRVAFPGVAPYAAFKGGLEVLSRYMAKEFGERGIRVNAVSPGPIRTELGGGLTPDAEAMLAAQTALGRVGDPDEVADVIAMLLSHDGRWINAQSIEVAGGYHV
jgi:NAD(P)-dependent dehydrogenase (short-subunit alcohol dehydrogenase family)